jgi:hypothetical protein
MGYRSDVVIVIMTKHLVKESPIFDEEMLRPEETLVQGEWTLYHWNWIKWCDYCPEIGAAEDWLAALPEQEFAFFRAGEEAGDFEYAGLATFDNEDCPFFVHQENHLDFGLIDIDFNQSIAAKAVRQANLDAKYDNTEMWDYLCTQVDIYRAEKLRQNYL